MAVDHMYNLMRSNWMVFMGEVRAVAEDDSPPGESLGSTGLAGLCDNAITGDPGSVRATFIHDHAVRGRGE